MRYTNPRVAQERMNGIESKHRDRSAAESAALFEEMIKGSKQGLKHCLRFKLDMTSPNKALRDPTAYRCNEHPHWRTKTAYKVCACCQLGQSPLPAAVQACAVRMFAAPRAI